MNPAKKLFSPDGNALLSARKVALRLDCAPDYVTKLCREGKLDGVRLRNVWYVKESSIARFQSQRETARAARSARPRRTPALRQAFHTRHLLSRVACVSRQHGYLDRGSLFRRQGSGRRGNFVARSSFRKSAVVLSVQGSVLFRFAYIGP